MTAAALDFSAFETDMNAALTRLDGLVERQQAVKSGAVSFDVSGHAAPPEEAPEAGLLILLDEAEKGPETVSFGFGETVSGALGQAQTEFDAFMEKINHDVMNFAHVESGSAGSPYATTRIDWSGDALTVLAAGTSQAERQQHSQRLARELALRNLRLRMLTTVASAASKILLIISNPASAVLALPMAYQYVSQLSEQWKAIQSLNQS